MNETEQGDIKIRPLTVDQYHRMFDAGIIDQQESVELLDGQLIVMPPEEPLHASVVTALNEVLILRFAGRATVCLRLPLALDDVSEPQPDLALVCRRDDYYRFRDPCADDVLLIVEVSQSTLAYDRRRKLGAYARNGICEVWIVNLLQFHVEVYLEPHELGYASSVIVGRDGTIAPRAFPDDVIAVAAFLP